MRPRTRLLAAFVVATLLMTVAGTIAQTQFVLAALAEIGAPARFTDRLSMTIADLIGFAPLYGAIIAVGFLIAFCLTALATRFANLPRLPAFAIAGGFCIWLMLTLMQEVFFGIPLIAGTRTAMGEIVQILCGALAGSSFAILSSGPTDASR